jgi:hypothetical protein
MDKKRVRSINIQLIPRVTNLNLDAIQTQQLTTCTHVPVSDELKQATRSLDLPPHYHPSPAPCVLLSFARIPSILILLRASVTHAPLPFSCNNICSPLSLLFKSQIASC